jgi:hypothetical protein
VSHPAAARSARRLVREPRSAERAELPAAARDVAAHPRLHPKATDHRVLLAVANQREALAALPRAVVRDAAAYPRLRPKAADYRVLMVVANQR